MKKIVSMIVVCAIVLLAACGGDDEGGGYSKEKQFLDKLSGTWEMNEASVGGEDVTNSFPGLEVTLTENLTYSVTEPVSPIWPSSGTFELEESADSFAVIRDDDVIITVMELTGNSLVMSFQYDADEGKTSSVSGSYIFEFSK